MGRLENRVAIVTGAAHGERAALGSHFAKALAAEGAKVAVADLKDCASIASEIESAGGEALGIRADVRDEQSVAAMVQATVKRFGRLDILVNNAAVGSNSPAVPVMDLDLRAWDELYTVNVRGPFLCVKAALPQMRRQKYGKIRQYRLADDVPGASQPAALRIGERCNHGVDALARSRTGAGRHLRQYPRLRHDQQSHDRTRNGKESRAQGAGIRTKDDASSRSGRGYRRRAGISRLAGERSHDRPVPHDRSGLGLPVSAALSPPES